MRRRHIAILGGAAALLFVAAFVASPWFAAARLVHALKTGDEAALEQLVDFRSVRRSLSSQISARLVAEAGREARGEASPFAGLVALIAPSMVDQAVQALVTPSGLARLSRLAREVDESRSQRRRDGGRDREPEPADPTFGYTGVNSFAATYFVKGGGRMIWTMEREKLVFWRLKRIEITDAVYEELALRID